MKRPDCLIVGAGIVGLSVAYRLMRRGLLVRVVAAGRPNASLAAAGMLAPGIEAAEAMQAGGAHPRLGELLLAAAGRWPNFAAELCDDPSDWTGIGFRGLDTVLAGGAAESGRFKVLAESAARIGARVQTISGEEARGLEPALSPATSHALRFAGDALVEPPLVVEALLNALRAGGAEIAQARIISAASNGHAVRLETADGDALEAGAAVLAAGWPATPIAPEFGRIVAIKGQIATLSARRPLNVMLRGGGVYLASRADGRVDAGATSERGIHDLQIDPAAIDGLCARAGALAPDLSRAWPIASRVGVRPGSPDHAPILGASALGARVFLAAATHRNGVLLAPLLADVVADGIIGGSHAGDWLDALSAGRFRT